MAAWALHTVPAFAANSWYLATGPNASDTNPGTGTNPVKSVSKAMSLAKPGDTIIFSAGTYLCDDVVVPSGKQGLPITLRSAGNGPVILTITGKTWKSVLQLGSYNIIDGLHLLMTSQNPTWAGFSIVDKDHIIIQNCRITAPYIGIEVTNSHYLTIENCEMAYCRRKGIHFKGSGGGLEGHFNPTEKCSNVTVKNCYIHDAGWAIEEGTEGYGIACNGAMEMLTIENCLIDNNSNDGILYEDWTINAAARYNIIRGTGGVAIWIDNSSMCVVENNFLTANNAAIWLSGEENSNRFLSDFIAVRNNIIVHNDAKAISPTLRNRDLILLQSNTRDVYFDNNTIAFNKNVRLVAATNRPPLNKFSNIWFRNNIFWENTGQVEIEPGINPAQFYFVNNLWSTPYAGDAKAKTGDPAFVDPKSNSPQGYKIKSGSAAIDHGLLLYENQLDFLNGPRPHLPKSGAYDIGAHEFGTTGTAHIGLDLSKFPFEVPPYEIRFKAEPKK